MSIRWYGERMFKRFYYILFQRFFILINKNNLSQGKIYMFHKINDEDDTYSISNNNFKSFIKYLIENKNIVDIETLIKEKKDNNVVLTFDDVYDDIYFKAYPILKKYDIPYYLFICNEYLDKDKYLSITMIKEMLSDSKCIIGSHNIKHQISRFLENKQFEQNILDSKKELEKLFKVSIDDFAFPYGSIYACSKSNIKISNNYFKNIYMTLPLNYNAKYDALPRININNKSYKKEIS